MYKLYEKRNYKKFIVPFNNIFKEKKEQAQDNTKLALILKVKLLNKSEIIVKAYNEFADFCYKELNKEDIIFLEGYLNSKMEVIIKTIKKEV